MKTHVMGKKIKNFYKIQFKRDENDKLQERPAVEIDDIYERWEEICTYDSVPQSSTNILYLNNFASERKINLSEDDEVWVVKECFRADLGEFYQYTDKVLEKIDVNYEECKEQLESLIKEYNKQKIEENEKAKAYCDLHKLIYEDTDYDELIKIIGEDETLTTSVKYVSWPHGMVEATLLDSSNWTVNK